MQLNNNDILYMITNKDYMKLFFGDGHNEIIEDDFKKYRIHEKKGYKKPVSINEHMLTPLSNTSSKICYWVNIKLFMRTYPYFKEILDKKEFDKTIKLLLKKS